MDHQRSRIDRQELVFLIRLTCEFVLGDPAEPSPKGTDPQLQLIGGRKLPTEEFFPPRIEHIPQGQDYLSAPGL